MKSIEISRSVTGSIQFLRKDSTAVSTEERENISILPRTKGRIQNEISWYLPKANVKITELSVEL